MKGPRSQHKTFSITNRGQRPGSLVSPLPSNARQTSQRYRRLALPGVIATLCLAGMNTACVTASADPAPGQVEEWPVPTNPRWDQFELGVGKEGYVWFLQGTTYYRNEGTVEGLSQSGPELLQGLTALGIDMALGPDGNMWITEQHSWNETGEPDTIGRLAVDSSSAHLTQFEIEEAEPGQACCTGPEGIVSGPNEHLWFTDQRPDIQHQAFIGEMDTSGHLVARHPIPAGTGLRHSTAPAPYDLAVGPGNSIWFTDDGVTQAGRNLVGRINSAGEAEEFPIPTIGAEPGAIVLGEDGAMWFTEPGKNKIGRVTNSGEVEEFPVPDVTHALKGLALGPEGNLWFAERLPTPGFGSISAKGEVKSYHPAFESLGDYGDADVGPYALVLGPDGNIWFTDPRPRDEFDAHATTDEGRFSIPLSPKNSQPPVVEGTPIAGSILSSSSGSWSNSPSSDRYQWQRCSNTVATCQNITGETAQSYLLSAADVGNHVRVIVTASNEAGESAAESELTTTVQPPVAQPPAAQIAASRQIGARYHQPEVVGATITSVLARSRHGVAIHALVLHGVEAGSTVAVTCRGQGCAFARTARHGACRHRTCKWTERITHGPAVNLTSLMRLMRLQLRARLMVVVTSPGWIGRAFEFHIGRSGVPGAVLSCRMPGSTEKASKC